MTLTNFFELFALLIFGHLLADYPLQGTFLARAKNRFKPLPGVPWYQALGAHAAIHGGVVGILTGNVWLGLTETAAHAIIDDRKCAGAICYNTDQGLHLTCKLLYVFLIAAGVAPLPARMFSLI